jgi:hypothetical protein
MMRSNGQTDKIIDREADISPPSRKTADFTMFHPQWATENEHVISMRSEFRAGRANEAELGRTRADLMPGRQGDVLTADK